MDQEKIGKFIASCRKDAGITQAALAEELGVTDRAVSKWENGKSLPDASNMIELCKKLNITINELLSGEHIAMEDYKEKAEENFLNIRKKVDKTMKMLNIISTIGAIISILLLWTTIILNWYFQGPWNSTPIMTAVCIIAGITIFNAVICTMLKYEV